MQLRGSIKVVRNAYNGTNKDETSFLLDKLALMAYALSQMVQQGHVALTQLVAKSGKIFHQDELGDFQAMIVKAE